MRGITSAQISRIWRVQVMICTESVCAQNGGSGDALAEKIAAEGDRAANEAPMLAGWSPVLSPWRLTSESGRANGCVQLRGERTGADAPQRRGSLSAASSGRLRRRAYAGAAPGMTTPAGC